MHLDGRSRPRVGTAGNRLSRWLAVLFPVTAAGTVFGQGYLVPPAGFQGAPAVPAMGTVTPATGRGNGQVSSQTIDQLNSQANGTAESNGQAASAVAEGNAPKEVTGAPLAAPVDALMNWGAAHVHLRASYQFMSATGIHNGPGKSKDTVTHTLAPGVTVNLGPHLTVDYSPSIRIYSSGDFHNTLDHALSANLGFRYGDWTFGASQKLLSTDEPTLETSSQIRQTDYGTSLFASYDVNEKVTLGTTAGIDLLYTSGGTNVFVGGTNATPSTLSDSRSYTGSETLDYKFNEHLTGGVMALVGYTEQVHGFRSVEEQVNGHLNWRPGTKLSAAASGGLERRSFLDSKAKDAWNPIYSANVAYQLFEPTAFSIYANRSTDASIFTKELSEDTGVGVSLQQRLLGKVHLSLGFGYNKFDYQSTTTTGLSTSRSDEELSYTAGASVSFLKRFDFATFYEYIQNSSSQKGFNIDSHQVGVTLSWAY